jgi:oligopeptidase B
MHKLILMFAALTSLAACNPADDPPGKAVVQTGGPEASQTTSKTIEEPMPAKRPHEMTIHDHTRVDEYYWLRDDTRQDPEVLAYLEAENKYFDQVMEPTKDLQNSLYEEMTARIDPDDSSVPYQVDDYWYYYRYEPAKEYAIWARRKDSMDGEEEILIDGNERGEGQEFYSLSGFKVSDDHRYVAIAEDFVGRRIHDIRVLDTQTNEYLTDQISNADAGMAWSADGQYLFYLNKNPTTLLAYQLMRHKLGSDTSEDVLIYEESDNTFYTSLSRSRSGEYLILTHRNTDTTEVQLLSAHQPLNEFKPFLPRETGHEYVIDHANDQFFIRTNWEAENFRVMAASLDVAGDKSRWTEIIPHRDKALVSSIQAFDNWLVVGERKDGLRRVRIMSHDGSTDRYMESGEEVFVMWPAFNASTKTDSVRYGFSSLTTANQIWEVDLNSGETKLLKADRVGGGFSSDDYRSMRIMVTARDGVEVPVSLAYHKSTPLDGSAPALIYAYGSYGASTDPRFRSAAISLMDRGFIYVIAHIRGGQDLGRQWYENGRLMNKKNTFTDFVDVTAALQNQGKIDPERTYAMGGSAGGLLMGVVINMAPDLYHGVIAAVLCPTHPMTR